MIEIIKRFFFDIHLIAVSLQRLANQRTEAEIAEGLLPIPEPDEDGVVRIPVDYR